MMPALLNADTVCFVPNSMGVGDTIIHLNKVYIIKSKTFDTQADQLYCKIDLWDDITLPDLLSNLYSKAYFETSGVNTNDIENNPRLTMLMVLSVIILGQDNFITFGDKYKSRVIAKWADKRIEWYDIFGSSQPVLSDLATIKSMAAKVFRDLKIAEAIWPFKSE